MNELESKTGGGWRNFKIIGRQVPEPLRLGSSVCECA